MRSKEEKASFIRSLADAVEIMEERGTIAPVTLLEDFSVRNSLLILWQKPTATKCAGFHDWKSAGRSVKKGSAGAAILVPTGSYTNEAGEDKVRFSWRYVFDIADTEELGENAPRLAREVAA
jgi:hypothetical protein